MNSSSKQCLMLTIQEPKDKAGLELPYDGGTRSDYVHEVTALV
mgnify:CR=1 FL=1